MGLVLDEPTADDVVFNENGITIVVEEAIISKLGGVRIHARQNPYVGTEFRVTPWNGQAFVGNHCGINNERKA